MAVKTLTTRVQQKSDTSANWAKATNFTPLKGEIIVYTDLRKIKIGDGVTKVGALEFANSKDAETLTGASLSTILNSSDVEIPTSKAVLDALNEKLDKVDARSDWNQNDETQPDYIKNRPFYESIFLTTVIEEQQIDFSSSFTIPNDIVAGNTYLITWDGTDYTITAIEKEIVAGEIYIPYLEQADGLFSIEGGFMRAADNGTHTVAISLVDSTIKTIDEKFIPSSILNKMDTLNPVGKGSFSLNRSPNYTAGDYSFAEGYYTVASGNASHAEGYETMATGSNSHAEGSNTIASEIDSHAEGQTTTSSGAASHAEGNYTIASGAYSHAEGDSTIASGENSHAEGEETKASSDNQHVQGKFNIENSSGTYAHIVGNGTSDTARSNAHTLDWSGNAWYAGKVSIGTTSNVPTPTDVNDLVTKQYVDNKFSTKTESVTSVNGQTGDVTLTANDVGAIDKYNGMTPVECVYTQFGSQQTKIIYVEEGTLIPPSSSASDDIKKAWTRLLAIPLSGTAATGPNSSFKDLIRGIGLLADNGVFGDLLSQSGNKFICYTDIFKQDVRLYIYNSKTADKTITVYFSFYKQDIYQQAIYCISNDTFDDYCSFEAPVKRYLSNINATVLTMPQTEMAAAPTKDMQIATKKYVDDSVSNPLNITSATVGQIAKITAVDDTGKPTAWEAVDDRLPDWNQNDATKPDYIKNRPFYTGDTVETVLVEESTVSFSFAEDTGLYAAEFRSNFEATVGETYKVYWDGAAYECTCIDFNGELAMGNLSIAGEGSDTGEPFIMVVYNGRGIIIGTADTSASHTFSISGLVTEVVKIDPKYIRDMYYTADPVETVLVEESTVAFADSGEGFYAAEFQSTFSAKVGDTYKVSWDGAAYECTCVNVNNKPAIGNLSIAGAGSDTGEPFLVGIFNVGQISIATQNTSASHTFSISGFVSEVVKIDEKYLPDTVATKLDVEAAKTAAENAQSTANTAQSTANSAKSTANSAKSTANSAKTAAENAQSTANSAKSTAENAQSTANTAKTEVAKALTVSSSGSITAPVNIMNAGTYQVLNITSKDQRHNAQFGVTESIGLQIRVGRDGGMQADISNPSTLEFSANGGSCMRLKGIDELIINSSTPNSAKEFKITVDDDYNVSATNTSDSISKTLATTEYVDNSVSNPLNITGATVGQITKITAVDDTGKPTSWEAVNDRLPNVSPSDDGKVLAVQQTGEFEYGYGFADMPKMYDFINLGIDVASPGQFAKVKYVDDFGHPTAWETVDMPNGQSAYDAAQAGGYTGTQANFYADLAAMQGLASALASI